MTPERIEEEAWEAFEVWLRSQSEDVQELGILDQIELYAAENARAK